jgi:hypothetical protein
MLRFEAKDMIEPAITDVISPAVAADDPDATSDQMIDH